MTVARGQPGTFNTATSAAVLATSWATNPAAGSTILVFAQFNTDIAHMSAVDNGVTPTTFTIDTAQDTASGHVFIFRGENITLPVSGAYAVTVTAASPPLNMQVMGAEYTGLQQGVGPAATNTGTATGTAVTTNAVSLSGTGVYFGGFVDQSGLNPETITLNNPGAPFSEICRDTNGATLYAMAAADAIGTGSQAATWTLGDSVLWASCIAAYAGLPTDVTRVAVTTGAPVAATAFTPTLPTHASGDRLLLAVVGKDQTTTIPTIDQSWTLLKSGTGGTGTVGTDTGQTFWAVYGIDATSSSMTAPTVTPGGTAPNSWEWVAASYRPAAGYVWKDAIGTSAAWVQSASDTTTASPLTGTAGAFTNQPTAGDAIFAVGVIPTDLGTALGATTLTATGLSGGTVTAATTQYVENALGSDTAAVWADWTSFTGTASAGVAASFTVTGATLQAGSIVAVALRQQQVATAVPVIISQAINRASRW